MWRKCRKRVILVNDISNLDMSDFLRFLDTHPETTEALDKWGSRYGIQKAHVVDWFASQETKGYGKYKRETPNSSAKQTYNRIRNAGMLLWLADVLGERRETLEIAVAEALKAEAASKGKACAGFRSVIPFYRIAALWENPSGWRYDPALKEITGFDENGYPVAKSAVEMYKALEAEGIY